MTEFKRALDAVGWDIAEVARRLEINRRTVARWYSGTNDAPGSVVDWLLAVEAAIDDASLPTW